MRFHVSAFLHLCCLLCGGMLLLNGCSAPRSVKATAPDMIVAQDGSGDYTSLQAAINAVPAHSNERTVILVKDGVYATEKLIVPVDKQNLTLRGASRGGTIISYHIHDCKEGGFNNRCPAEDARRWAADIIRTSATLTVLADDFIAENLTLRNTAGPVGQAQAITVRGDRVVFRNCDLLSYQDTVYLWSRAKRTYFEGCLIVGRTDYIYGGGTAFFQECEIRSWGGGWITAPATGEDQPFGFVFHGCKLTYAADSPRAGDDGRKIALGRPWHHYPKVAWINCEMTAMIDPLGWPTKWRMDYADTSKELQLYEYNNTGGGADMTGRSGWAGIREMTPEEASGYSVRKVLGGDDNWQPSGGGE